MRSLENFFILQILFCGIRQKKRGGEDHHSTYSINYQHHIFLSCRHLSWADVRARALALDVTTTDEHVFKLIQVCLERKDGDSLVPGMGAICKRAALTAMSKGFFEPPRKEW